MIGVIGASGFIGRHVVRRLLDKGHRVRAASRSIRMLETEMGDENLEIVPVDINAPTSVASVLQDVDVVVQLVSTSSPGLQNRYSEADIRENVIPQVNFVQSAIEAGVKRYLFLSSGGTVYGPGQNIPIREDAPTNPISSHGLTKLTIEKYLHMHGYVDDLDYVVLRLSNAFGPGQVFRKGQGLIPAILARHREKKPIQIIGKGAAVRDYVYIGDVADAICLAVGRKDVAKSTINIGSGEPRSVLEVVDAVEQVLGVTFEREYIDSRSTDVDVNVLDISRAQELLGWRPSVAFRDGLAAMIKN